MNVERVRPPLVIRPYSPLNDLELAERVLFMSACQIFAGLSIPLETSIALKARVRRFDRGTIVFMQGEPFAQFVIITAGFVKLTHVDAQGNEVIYCLRGPHDTIDLPAGLNFANRTYTAKAISTCKALVWTQDTMMSLLTAIPLLHLNIGTILNRQLLDLQERFNELAGDKVERRLASMLIRLALQIGTPSRIGTRINISRQELAQMAGTNIFSVSRTISRWAELGLVIPCREAVIIADLAKLQLAGSSEHENQGVPKALLLAEGRPLHPCVLLPPVLPARV